MSPQIPFHRVLFLVAAFAVFSHPLAPAEEPPRAKERIPLTTSRFHGRPEPPLPFRAERVYPKLAFKNPTVLTNAPGTRRLFVAEQKGKIFALPEDLQGDRADLFLNVEDLVARLSANSGKKVKLDSVYGLTFHPQFAANGYCYLCYVVAYDDGTPGMHPEGTRVVRLHVTGNPPRCEVASETLLLTWLQGGHNGGCLKFGPDGCLYISTGDGGDAFPPDGHKTGQDISDLLASILRIDVDHPPAGENYAIPADNPFAKRAKARGEVWAYGVRNPWKMSFDRATGELWIGDVGWELWELVERAERGDNFGWSIMEGRQPVHTELPTGPTPIKPPAIEIPHSEGASVTGGFVYRGQQFPELVGEYIFGDWETRRIWGVPVNKDGVGERREILEPTVRVIDFSEDNAGELYLLDYDDGTIHTIARNPAVAGQQSFPQRLSESGLFAKVAVHEVAPGVVPFAINAEAWADFATAEHYLAVPGRGAVVVHPQSKAIPGSMFSRKLDFPADTVLLKTLSLTLKEGEPARRVETQVLHFDGHKWRGYSYRWNAEQADAELVPAAGAAQRFDVLDSHSPGGRRTQLWRFASRHECVRCHNPWSEFSLAFNLPQLNRPGFWSPTNQIDAFRETRILASESNKPAAAAALAAEKLPRLTNPHDTSASLENRARSYLHVNCAHCHRSGGGGSAYVHLPFDVPLAEMKSLGVRPKQGDFGIANAEVIAKGDPFRSVLFCRVAKAGPGHMPMLGSSLVDPHGVKLLSDWISSLPGEPSRDGRLGRLQASKDGAIEEHNTLTAEMLANTTSALELMLALRAQKLPLAVQAATIKQLAKADATVRDLFDPLLPDDQRQVRLADTLTPDVLAKLTGDRVRGERLFHESALQCRNCHRIETRGGTLGPELTHIGKKLTRAKLLENIIEPSKEIEPKYQTWLVQTKDGEVLTGLIVARGAGKFTLADVQDKRRELLDADIERMLPQRQSLMPDLLLSDLAPQQVADLLAYLESLK